MEALGVRTSFIPKATMAPRAPRREGMGFFVFICVALLFVSLLGWLVSFGYKSLVAKDVNSLDQSLTKAREQFDPNLLKVFENLDRRLRAGSNLLDVHTNLEPLFTTLDAITLKTVRYRFFSYTNNGSMAVVRISGEAVDFPSVALQALQYNKDRRLINPIFSNLGVDALGQVTFDVSFNIDQSLVSYSRGLSGGSAVTQ